MTLGELRAILKYAPDDLDLQAKIAGKVYCRPVINVNRIAASVIFVIAKGATDEDTRDGANEKVTR